MPEIEQAGKDGDYDKALSEFQRLKKADIAKAAAVFYKTNPDLRDAFRGDEGHPFITKMTKQQMLDKLESDFDKYNGDDAAREANGELDVEPVQPTEPATEPTEPWTSKKRTEFPASEFGLQPSVEQVDYWLQNKVNGKKPEDVARFRKNQKTNILKEAEEHVKRIQFIQEKIVPLLPRYNEQVSEKKAEVFTIGGLSDSFVRTKNGILDGGIGRSPIEENRDVPMPDNQLAFEIYRNMVSGKIDYKKLKNHITFGTGWGEAKKIKIDQAKTDKFKSLIDEMKAFVEAPAKAPAKPTAKKPAAPAIKPKGKSKGKRKKGRHPNFSDSAYERLNTGVLSREILIDMPVGDFIKMAETAEPIQSKVKDVEKLLDEGVQFNDIPFLEFNNDQKGNAKIVGHEGRHRARALKKRGVKTIPVVLKSVAGETIRWSEQADAGNFDRIRGMWPKVLVEQNYDDLKTGKRKEGKATIPFPVKDPLAAVPPPIKPATPPALPQTIYRFRDRDSSVGEEGLYEKLQKEGKIYRGMTETEYVKTVAVDGMIKSRQDYSVKGEGTSFSERMHDAESYVNTGRDNPNKTGKPTYIVEASRGDLKETRDGYVKSQVPIKAERVWKIDSHLGALFGKQIPVYQPSAKKTPALPKAPKLTKAQEVAKDIANISMYRGSRSNEPEQLAEEFSYFISNEMFAKTYGDVAEFNLQLKNPKIVTDQEWGDYDTQMSRESELGRQTGRALQALKNQGFDSAVSIRETLAGKMYVVVALSNTAKLGKPEIKKDQTDKLEKVATKEEILESARKIIEENPRSSVESIFKANQDVVESQFKDIDSFEDGLADFSDKLREAKLQEEFKAKKQKQAKPTEPLPEPLQLGERDYVGMLDNMELTPDQQALWDDLKNAVSQQKLGFPKLEIVNEIINSKGKVFKAHGGYDPKNHTVQINKQQATGYLPEVLLHELVHAATRQAVKIHVSQGLKIGELAFEGDPITQKSKRIYNRLTVIAKEVENSFIGEEYAESKRLAGLPSQQLNENELIAYALSRPKFRKYLSGVKVAGVKAKAELRSKNLLDAFMDFIKDALGLSNRSITALQEVMQMSDTLMQEEIDGEATKPPKKAPLKPFPPVKPAKGIDSPSSIDSIERGYDNFVSGGQKSPTDIEAWSTGSSGEVNERGVGVSVYYPQQGKIAKISGRVQKAFVQAANNGKQIFIDSGVASLAHKGLSPNHKEVLATYMEMISDINKKMRRNVYVVAPDVLELLGKDETGRNLFKGNPEKTLKLLAENSNIIWYLQEQGVNVIIPMQKGDGIFSDFSQVVAETTDVVDFSPTDGVVLGAPFNDAAWSEDELFNSLISKAMAGSKWRLHLLGGGSAKTNNLQKRLNDAGVDVVVTGDAATEMRNQGNRKSQWREDQKKRGADLTKELKKKSKGKKKAPVVEPTVAEEVDLSGEPTIVETASVKIDGKKMRRFRVSLGDRRLVIEEGEVKYSKYFRISEATVQPTFQDPKRQPKKKPNKVIVDVRFDLAKAKKVAKLYIQGKFAPEEESTYRVKPKSKDHITNAGLAAVLNSELDYKGVYDMFSGLRFERPIVTNGRFIVVVPKKDAKQILARANETKRKAKDKKPLPEKVVKDMVDPDVGGEMVVLGYRGSSVINDKRVLLGLKSHSGKEFEKFIEVDKKYYDTIMTRYPSAIAYKHKEQENVVVFRGYVKGSYLGLPAYVGTIAGFESNSIAKDSKAIGKAFLSGKLDEYTKKTESKMTFIGQGSKPKSKGKSKKSGGGQSGGKYASKPSGRPPINQRPGSVPQGMDTRTPEQEAAAVQSRGYPKNWIKAIMPVELPELVDLVRQLSGGKLPKLNHRLQWRTAGNFNPNNKQININPRLALDPQALLQTLAHELGHLKDFLDEETMGRGNILGRLFSLINYRKKLTADLTSKDQKRLRSKAKRIAERKHGGTATEAQIIVEYTELVKAEGIIANDAIKQELIALTKWWSGDYGNANKKYIRYRESAEELYAEAISVLLVSPKELENRAPMFYETWHKQLNNKPSVQTAYLEIQQLLNGDPIELAKARTANVQAMFEETQDMAMQLREDEDARMGSISKSVKSFLGDWQNAIIDTSAAAKKKTGKKQFGNITNAKAEAARYALDDLNTKDTLNYKFFRRVDDEVFQPLVQTFVEGGMSEKDARIAARNSLGEYMLYRRIQNGGRTRSLNDPDDVDATYDLINPLGIEPAQVPMYMDWLKKSLGKDVWRSLNKSAGIFNDLIFEIAEDAVDIGIYSQKLMDSEIEPNKDNYAAFRVMHHALFYTDVTPMIKEQVGTFSLVANPFEATMLKYMNLNRLIIKQRAAKATTALLKQDFSKEIRKLKRNEIINKRQMEMDGKGIIYQFEDGKLVKYLVADNIAEAFQIPAMERTLATVERLLNSAVYNVFHPLFVTYSMAFALKNPLRDIRRAGVNLGATDGVKFWTELVPAYVGSLKEGWDFASGDPVQLAEDMIDAGAMDVPFTRRERFKADKDILLLDETFVKMGIMEGKPDSTMGENLASPIELGGYLADEFVKRSSFIRNKRGRQLKKAGKQGREIAAKGIDTAKKYTGLGHYLDFAKKLGETTEVAMKVAGWKVLADRNLTDAERAYRVKKFVGTPDYKQAGMYTGVTNGIMMYSKVRWNGLQADLSLATDKEIASRWWWRQTLNSILPTSFSKLCAYGAFGVFDGLGQLMGYGDEEGEEKISETLERYRGNISTYFFTSYDSIPLGLRKREGKWELIWLSIPRDDLGATISKLWWNVTDMMIIARGKEVKDGSSMSDAVGNVLGDIVGAAIPDLAPPLQIAYAYGDYAVGNNPESPFLGGRIIDDDHYEMGGSYAAADMLEWTFDQFGVMGAIAKYGATPILNEKGEAGGMGGGMSELKALGAVTGLSSYFRWSDTGIREKEYGDKKRKKRADAQKRIDVGKTAKQIRRIKDSLHEKVQNGTASKEQIKAYNEAALFIGGVADPAREMMDEMKAAGKSIKSLQQDVNAVGANLDLLQDPPASLIESIAKQKRKIVYSAAARPRKPKRNETQKQFNARKQAYEQSRKAAYDKVKQAVPDVNDAVQLLAEHYLYKKGVKDDGTPMFGMGVVRDIPEFEEGRKWLMSKVYRD